MIGYMAWDLKAGWSEILLATIRNTVDSIRYRQIVPDLMRSQSTVYPLDKTGTFSSLLPEQLMNTASLQRLGADVFEGSNNWAVSGSKSVTGKPLFANDMHLGLSVPGIWYQIHQVIPGKLNVTGLALPGAPVIICGHNDSIAWGMTNTYVDNLDFYEEKINPDDSGMYLYNGEWRKFEVIKTVIQVSNGEKAERTLRFSHRGPVVSSFKQINDRVVSMHWVGDEESNELKSVLGLNRAKNWNDFRDALRTFTSLSQNINYADVNGNIGLYCAAGVPIRNRDIAQGVLPGHTDAYDWKGYVPFDELPHIYNPPDGYVASANNRTVPMDYPYHIGTWYALPDRYNRIIEMLTSKEGFSVEDFKLMQLDQRSKLVERYMPYFLEALEKYDKPEATETRAYETLRDWDYTMSVKSSGATIFGALYLQLFRCIFADELGESLFTSFNGVTTISRTAMDQLIDSRMSQWFDDVATTHTTETFNDRVICAFSKAVDELENRLGSDVDAWEWGRLHHLVLAHPLAAVDILNKAFHLNREYPVGGDFHTVSPFSFSSNRPYHSDHGSSHRHIYDLSNWDNSLSIIPTGNSGIPASRHYCDQTEMYVNGWYHRDLFSREKVVENARYHMTFKP
jgi:penicillin amidase